METKPTFSIVPKPPVGFAPFLLTFKGGDFHPYDKVPMDGRAVRIYAPTPEAAAEVVRHRFGNKFKKLYDERNTRVIFYPNGLWETLIWVKK
jgi:hypothetical protein